MTDMGRRLRSFIASRLAKPPRSQEQVVGSAPVGWRRQGFQPMRSPAPKSCAIAVLGKAMCPRHEGKPTGSCIRDTPPGPNIGTPAGGANRGNLRAGHARTVASGRETRPHLR
jgi:hypothetical protein